MQMKKPIYPGLRACMARDGIGHKELAEFLQISTTSVNNKLQGSKDWKINEIEKLCKFFNADYYELFTRTGKYETL